MIDNETQKMFWEMVKAQTDRGAILSMVYKELELLQSENCQLKGDMDTAQRERQITGVSITSLMADVNTLRHKLDKAEQELAKLEKVRNFLDDVSDMITDQLAGGNGHGTEAIIGAKRPVATDQDNDGPVGETTPQWLMQNDKAV